MAAQDERYRQAAWTYVVYGVVYWLGGLALAQSGLGPRGMERGRWAWFIIGALFVVIFPWLLMRAWRWRRGLSRVSWPSWSRIARSRWRGSPGGRAGRPSSSPASPSPMQAGAWAFCLLALVTALMLARAAWSRQP